MFPLRTGTDADFAACRRALDAIGFDEPSLLGRYGIRSLSELGGDRPGPARADALEVATRLFLESRSVPRREAEAVFPAGALGTMDALGLVVPVPGDARSVASPVLLHPRRGIRLACDRPRERDDAARAGEEEPVYASLTEDAERFLDVLPAEACDDLLDLGTGAGPAALWAAATCARRAVGTDVSDRAVAFAEFNRRLNGLANAEFLAGDLFAPVAGRTFDRIVMHPPYLPSLRGRVVAEDGGPDGQDLLRRALEGLAAHLRPGGRFVCLSLAADREEAPHEREVRRLLGAAAKECDVAFLERRVVDAGHLARGVAIREGGGRESERTLLDGFRRRGVRRFVYGDTIVLRHAEGTTRRPFTARRRRAETTTTADVEWLLRCEARLAPADRRWLLAERPRMSAGARLVVEHAAEEGALVPAAWGLRAVAPFPLEIEASPGFADLLAQADGRRTGREIFDRLRERGALGDDATEAGFAELAARLVAAGILVLPDLLPPATPAGG